MKFAFAASAHLRNGKNAFRAMIEMYQQRKRVVCLDGISSVATFFAEEKDRTWPRGLWRTGTTVARSAHNSSTSGL